MTDPARARRIAIRLAAALAALAITPVAPYADKIGTSTTDPSDRGTEIERKLAQGAMSRFRFAASRTVILDATVVSAPDGSTIALASLRGRIVLINVWASWCPPCREEMPSIAALRRRLEGEGLTVAAISIDRNPADALRFVDELALRDLPLYFDPAGLAAAALDARGVPVSVLLDEDGREIGRLRGAADWMADDALLLVRAALRGRLQRAP
jgi:thiol-disulfide isomerase/thioredoxin